MPRPTITTLLAVVAIAWTASADAGTTYYVKGDCGNDVWSGTSPACTPPHGPKATIQAAIDVATDGDEILVGPYTYGERIDFLGKAIALRSQTGPQTTTIDGQRAGTVVTCFGGEGPDTVLEGFTITGGLADQGGGMFNLGSSPTVRDCIFTENEANIGGGMRNRYDSSPLIEDCSFIENIAYVAGGGLVNSEGQPVIRNCLFLQNDGSGGIGAVGNLTLQANPPAFVNCLFVQNHAGWIAGAVDDGSGALWVNCVFSRNVTEGPDNELGAMTFVYGEPLVVNCTFSANTVGLSNIYEAVLTVRNSIIWGNSEGSVQGYGDFAFSDIEGGRPGPGNLDADPLFVQPGMDNVRLSIGSPCVNAGDNDAVPPDITTDLDGNPRIQDGVVDMGAYEGEFAPEAPAAGESDLDNGEHVVLIPTGGQPNPLEKAMAIVVNTSGPDDATVVVTEYEQDLYWGSGGHSELSCILDSDTSLEDGQYRAKLFIPFSGDGTGPFDPVDPAQVNVTRFDPEVGAWALAVAGNTAASPGFDGPVGDRILSLEGPPWNQSNELGDYGVCWDPVLQQGFAWANVDREADFGVGVALCPADCRQTPDGAVGVADFLALLAQWGDASVGGPCDIDFDGVIGLVDFLALLESWGVCPAEAVQAAAGAAGAASSSVGAKALVRSPDIDSDGAVGRDDLELIRSSWGPCGLHCDADLNTDGHVDVRDFLMLLANWR